VAISGGITTPWGGLFPTMLGDRLGESPRGFPVGEGRGKLPPIRCEMGGHTKGEIGQRGKTGENTQGKFNTGEKDTRGRRDRKRVANG